MTRRVIVGTWKCNSSTNVLDVLYVHRYTGTQAHVHMYMCMSVITMSPSLGIARRCHHSRKKQRVVAAAHHSPCNAPWASYRLSDSPPWSPVVWLLHSYSTVYRTCVHMYINTVMCISPLRMGCIPDACLSIAGCPIESGVGGLLGVMFDKCSVAPKCA